MNTEIIIWNECISDNSKVHLYWDETIRKWCGFGISAFSIVLWQQKNHSEVNSHYYDDLSMPVTLINNCELLSLIQDAADVEEISNSYICLSMSERVNMDQYSSWVGHLRKDL